MLNTCIYSDVDGAGPMSLASCYC